MWKVLLVVAVAVVAAPATAEVRQAKVCHNGLVLSCVADCNAGKCACRQETTERVLIPSPHGGGGVKYQNCDGWQLYWSFDPNKDLGISNQPAAAQATSKSDWYLDYNDRSLCLVSLNTTESGWNRVLPSAVKAAQDRGLTVQQCLAITQSR